MYCLNLLATAMELAKEDPTYEDVVSKLWEHFRYIANASTCWAASAVRCPSPAATTCGVFSK
jgi:hypothetical protein